MHIIKFCRVFIIISCLSFLFCSCNSGSTTGVTKKDITSTSSTATPTSIPQVQTTCPADGTARAAILPPIKLGQQPSIVYVSNADPGSGIAHTVSTLKRYDVTTTTTTDILKPQNPTGTNGLSNFIDDAQLSPDGQWIIFQTAIEGKRAIQLVRIDGQELQTLYCSPLPSDPQANSPELGRVDQLKLAWSPDQKYLAFAQFTPDKNGIDLCILEMSSGKLQIDLQPTVDGISYNPLKWSGNTSLFVDYLFMAGDGDRHLNLLLNTAKDSSQQGPNLQQINLPSWNTSLGACQDFDISPDVTQILLSSCTYMNSSTITGPSSILIHTATGDFLTQIYQNQTHGIRSSRYLSNSTIVFTIANTVPADTSQNGLWKINTDGTGLTRLVSTTSDNERMNLAPTATATWANVSRDGTLFALSVSANTSSLLFGSLMGGSTTTFDTEPSIGNDNAQLVGWTTF